MVFETALDSIGFLAARILYGTVLGYLALGNLIALDESVAYARSKGAPKPDFGVPLGSLLLLGGAASIGGGAYPAFGALAVILFLVGITPIMHDFWAIDGEAAENERIHFLKNVGLVAVALVFLLLADQPWPFALDIHV
jgi:uncharacterized membrane protein YphA (DoxX/SURF4 family)